MRLEYSPFVESDIEAIADYIGEDNPTRSVTFVDELWEEIRKVGRDPMNYRIRPEYGKDARMAVVGQYVILFRIMQNTVRIERVVYGGRDLPALLLQ